LKRATSLQQQRSSDATEIVELLPLKFADVSEVAGILVAGQQIAPNDQFAPQLSQLSQPPTFGGGMPGGYSSPPIAQQTTIAGGAQAQSFGQRINDEVAIDRRLNAIVLTGSRTVVDRYRELVAKLDVPAPSVLLQAELVELNESAAKDVGIDYTNSGQLAAAAVQTRSYSTPSIGTNLQAAIYDRVSHGGGKIIARPQIVAQNGYPASILTGDAIPIVTNVTSFGSSTITQQQVQYVQVGVNLQIQSRISEDGRVAAHIFAQVSSVTGYVQGFPQISQRIATTSTTVNDGEPFFIGGLVQESELRSLEKIPGIGDLPIFGPLFRLRRESRALQNLYILVTPHVIGSRGIPTPPQAEARPM